ncbi:MAG: methyl-accepting chemotaxis protein [Lachnospiraceae bacterium]|nr:methyl-accepting chemotaxis protein [Lachnospiraceae bacterium]
MFGRRREAELENRLIEYKTMTKGIGVELKYHLEQMNANLSGLQEDAGALEEKDENIGRELSYAGAITEKLIKDIEKKEEEIGKKEEFSNRMREALGDKDAFDVDLINRNADKINDEIRTNERKVGNITEEIRGIELISSKMKDIAGKTSALSLNAAIMGARIDSGEEGFVQTATEIKELAAEYSRILTELNRRVERLLSITDEITASNSEMKTLAGEGLDAAKEFTGRYEELYKEYGKKSWEKEEKYTDFEATLEDIRTVARSIEEAGNAGKAAAEDAKALADKLRDHKTSTDTAVEMVAKMDKIM